MAIHLEANYSKKLGLPGFSSHQFSLTLKTEVSDLAHVQDQSSSLYDLLQSCVDRDIQKIGYLPDNGSGNMNGHQNNGNGKGETWNCSPKQQNLILKIVEQHQLERTKVEALAQERFGKTVRALNKPEMSGLIDELLAQTAGIANGNQRRRFSGRITPASTP